MQLKLDYFSTISRIYDAALKPEAWTDALDQIARHSGASYATLAVIDHNHPECHINATSKPWSPAQLESYARDVSPGEAQDWRALKGMLPPQELVSDTEFFPDRQAYDSLPMVRWGLENFGFYHRAAALLSSSGAWIDAFAIQFSVDRGPIEREERAIASLFLPHVAKVVELNRPFRILEARFKAVIAALDRFHVGVCILSKSGAILVANVAARRAFDARDALRLDPRGLLRCCDREADRQFQAARTEVSATAGANGTVNGRTVVAPRPVGREPLLLDLAPLTDPAQELDAGLQGALLFVIDPEDRAIVSTEGLRSLYHLTAAEADVCRLLVEGHGSGDIAEIRGVTTETVRSQVRALFSKTGVDRRTELVRLALTINLPIDRG